MLVGLGNSNFQISIMYCLKCCSYYNSTQRNNKSLILIKCTLLDDILINQRKHGIYGCPTFSKFKNITPLNI